MSAEFSRRVNVQLIKDEPLNRDEWAVKGAVTMDDLQAVGPGRLEVVGAQADAASSELMDELYRRYLDRFQPYRWRAVAANNEPLAPESYFNEADAINTAELLFGDDTTVYWAPMYGEDRHFRLLRYGKTDREHQAAAALSLLDGTTEFMRAAGQLDDPPVFGSATDDLRVLRRRLLAEEYSEYLAGEGDNDLVEAVDGLLDLIVIAWGSILAYVGEEKAKAAAAEVVRSNLDKIGPDGKCVKRDDGKILKPDGWQAPDIAGAIA